MTVEELIQKYRKALPRSDKYRAHAINLAWLVLEGDIAGAKGYLQAMETEWVHSSRAFSYDRFNRFRREVLEDVSWSTIVNPKK